MLKVKEDDPMISTAVRTTTDHSHQEPIELPIEIERLLRRVLAERFVEDCAACHGEQSRPCGERPVVPIVAARVEEAGSQGSIHPDGGYLAQVHLILVGLPIVACIGVMASTSALS
jgi:hypothetical protein